MRSSPEPHRASAPPSPPARRDRLDDLAAKLAGSGPCTVEVHAADLTDPGGLRSAEDLIAATPSLELLVNNAGFAGYGPFTALDPAIASALTGVHVTAPTRLTRAALPAMTGRGHGAVINIASLLAFSGSLPPGPLPFRATYAAAKAYLVTFTCALAGELAATGMRVQACCPGPAATEFLHGTGTDPGRLPITPMDPGDVVTASLTALDLGETVCIPGLGDPAAIEGYHAAARQLVQARRACPGLPVPDGSRPAHPGRTPRPAAQPIIPGRASPRRRRAEAGRALLRAPDSPERTTRWLSRPHRKC
jgi:uncharacterized protein